MIVFFVSCGDLTNPLCDMEVDLGDVIFELRYIQYLQFGIDI